MKNQNDPVDVVYKFVDYKRFYPQMDEYLGGDLFFADWHSFEDKREGKYLCSSSVRKDLRKKIRKAKYRYRVCSTTLGDNIFELWERYLINPPAICLAIKLDKMNTVNENQQNDNELSMHHIDYVRELKSCSDPTCNDHDKKAVEILTTKKNRYFYEEEFRLVKKTDLEDGIGIMHHVGKVIGVIVGGYCSKEDNCFIKLRNAIAALDKNNPPYFKRAYIDFSLESVKIEDDVWCSVNDLMNRAPRSRITP